MAGMYEIVGFDEIVGAYPPGSPVTSAAGAHGHHLYAGLEPAVIGDEMYAGDALIAGDELFAGLDAHDLVSGVDPAEQLLAVAGLTAPNVRPQAIRQAMLRGFQPRTIDVRSRAARAPRRLVLNFRALAVAPGPAIDIPARPQLPFRPERLFVQSDIAGNFEIVDIIIGNRSQFAQATPMSARIAAETSFGFDLHMDTAMVAMDVNLRVQNITAAPSDFRATIIGTSAIP